ncbi:MAG: thiamine phosphate synthase, partial [Sulfuricurvum sp.]
MKSYLITDPSYYGTTPDHLESALDVVYSHNLPEFAVFRDKQTSDYPTLAQTFVTISREYKIPR